MRGGGAARIYVYYRVAADTTAACDAVAALFAAVEAATGVAGHLLARCDDAHTWMEVYEPVADAAAFLSRLDPLVRQHDVARLAVDGERHTECFAPLRAVGGTADRAAPLAGAG